MSDFSGKRILILLLAGGVGDVLLSTVVLKPLKDYYPDSYIAMMVKTGMEDLLEENELVSEVLSVRDGNLKGENFDYWLERVRERRFDIAIVLWNRSQEAHLVFRAGIPVRVGQGSRLFYSFLYTHKVSVRSEHGDVESHWTDIMLDYVRALGIPVGKPEISIRFHSDDVFYDMRLLLASNAGDCEAPFWGLHVCKGLELSPDRWPVKFFAALGDAIVGELGGSVVLTGTERELPVVNAVAGLMRKPCVNAAGKTTLRELAALMNCFDGFVAPDTGPGHIAAVMGIPTVSIFALKSDFPNRWRPFGNKTAVVVPKSWTCSRGKCVKEKCCDGFMCYNDVDPAEVVARLSEMRPLYRVGDRAGRVF